MELDFRHCPFCDNEISSDTKIYIRNDTYIGCDYCIEEDYIEDECEENEEYEEELELFFQEQDWDNDKIMERLGL